MSKKLHIGGFSLLFLWELLGVISPSSSQLISRPSNIIVAYFTREFVHAVAYLVVIPVLSIVPGSWMGVVTAKSLIRFQVFPQHIVEFLGFVAWIPFFLTWTLPIWPTHDSYWQTPFRWLLATSILTVALHTCHGYLVSRLEQTDMSAARRVILFRAIRVASLLALCSQFWSPTWFWSLAVQNNNVSILIAVFVFVSLSLFVTEKLSRLNVDVSSFYGSYVAKPHVPVWSLAFHKILALLMCLAVWNLIGVVASYPVVVSPWAVVSGAVDILLNSSAVTMKNIAIWGNTSTSVVEIWTGLMFALALALITVRFVPSANLSNLLSRAVFGVSDASALLLAMIVIYWRMNSYIPNLSFRFTTFHTALFVASLCYLPLLTAMCSLREPVSFDRVIIGLLGALPFAFIGMIYGEAFGSTSGLAFTMINAGASSRRIDQVVYCVFLITYFGLFSFVLEWLAFRKQE